MSECGDEAIVGEAHIEGARRYLGNTGIPQELMQGMRRTKEQERIKELVEAAATARRLFPRGGYEGLDTTSLQVLLALCSSQTKVADGIDVLAARLALDPSTVSHAMGSLRAKRLVRAGSDHADGRRRVDTPTASGYALARAFAMGHSD